MTGEKYLAAKGAEKNAPSVKSTNPFDALDCKYSMYDLITILLIKEDHPFQTRAPNLLRG